MTATLTCCQCDKKESEIAYLKALLALNGLESSHKNPAVPPSAELLTIKQQQAILRKQLALIRADVQYFNRNVQAVLQWVGNVISVFLTCCGRVGESAASKVVHVASSVLGNVSKSQNPS